MSGLEPPVESAPKRTRFEALGPKYVNATAFWQDMISAASLYNPTYTTAAGERFEKSLAQVVPASMANQGLPIMIPANNKIVDEEQMQIGELPPILYLL